MATTQAKYSVVLTVAATGVVLVCAGLYLAALSNPWRFSLNVSEDRKIGLLAVSGFACTIAGIGLLLTAARSTTKSIPRENREKASIGVGIGFALQCAGVFLCRNGWEGALIGLPSILASVPLFIWGCSNYAEGKGYSKRVGLVGVAGIVGLITLMVLPDQHEELSRNA